MNCVLCLLLILVSSNVHRIVLALGDTLNQPGVCPRNKSVIRYSIVTEKVPLPAKPPCSRLDYHRTHSKKCISATTEVKVTRQYATNITIFTCCPGFKPLGNTCIPDAMPPENDATITLNQKENRPEEGIDMDVFLMAFSIVAAGIVTVVLIIILSVQCRWISCLNIRRLKQHGVVRVTRRAKKRNSRQEFAYLAQSGTSSHCSCIGMADQANFEDDTSTTSLHRRSLPSLYEIQGFHVKPERHRDPYPLLDQPFSHNRPRPTGRSEAQKPISNCNNQFDCDDYAVVLSFGNSFRQNAYSSVEQETGVSANDYVTSLNSKIGHLATNSRQCHVFSPDMNVTNDYVTGVGTRLDDMAVGYVTTVGTHSDLQTKKEPRLFPSSRQCFAAAELDSVAEYITSVKTTHDNIRSIVNRDSTSTYDSSYMTPMDATRTLSSNAASVDYDDVDVLHTNYVCGQFSN